MYRYIKNFCCVLIMCLILAGCGAYRIKDERSGKLYYTRYFEFTGDGAVSFEDARTGKRMTLPPDFEIRDVSEEEFTRAQNK